jgi:glycosyltransferase involved in cell wall biosynthesis
MVLVDTKEMNHLLRDCCEVNVQVHRSPGVDPGVFAPRLKDASRKDLALSCQGCVLLFASGFQRHSDFDTLLKAAGILSQRGFCFTLLLVGAGPRWSEVSRKVRGWGLGDRVVLLGAVPLERLSDCIAASDICLNIVDVVTLREGSFRATKLAEYVCSERPVISTACADAEMPEWALGGLCLVPPASPESLADAIVSVFAALPEWDEHARLARQLIVKDWSWVQVTRSTLAHIDSLIAASRNGHVVAAWPDSSLRE